MVTEASIRQAVGTAIDHAIDRDPWLNQKNHVRRVLHHIADMTISEVYAETHTGHKIRPRRERNKQHYTINDDGVMTALPTWERDELGCHLRLSLTAEGAGIDENVIASWTDEQIRQADIWAWTTHLSAGDNDDIQVPPRPDHIPPPGGRIPPPHGRHPITGEPI